MIRRLDRYVARIFFVSLCAALLLAAGLLVLGDLLNSMDNFVGAREKLERAGAPDLARAVVPMALRYYAFEISIRLLQFTPFVTFFAATFTAARLHRTSETTAILASGTSLHRGFLAVFVAAAAITAAQVAFRERWIPPMARELSELRANLLAGKPRYEVEQVFVVDVHGARARFGRYRPNLAEGDDLRADATRAGVHYSVTARAARWVSEPGGSGRFELEGGKLVKFERDGGAAGAPQDVAALPPPFALTEADCELAARAGGDPMYLSVGEIDTLARRLPSIAKYQVMFHSALTALLANLLLPLLGLPCILRADRRSALEGAVFAFGLVVLYFVVTLFCYQLGAEGYLGPVFAAWLPVVLFGSLGITLFESMRT